MCKHTEFIEFRTAAASGGNQSGPNCVEVGEFFTAQASGAAGHCVEVAFTKAEESNPSGNCVEVAHAKPTASVPNGACVEPGQATAAAHEGGCTPETCSTPGITPGDIVVRDSKDNGEGCPVAVFTADEWREIVARVAAGDDTAHHGSTHDRPWVIIDPRTQVVLGFTQAEWDAFRDGCGKGEFTYSPLETVPA